VYSELMVVTTPPSEATAKNAIGYSIRLGLQIANTSVHHR
jgi:hypothetical protein